MHTQSNSTHFCVTVCTQISSRKRLSKRGIKSEDATPLLRLLFRPSSCKRSLRLLSLCAEHQLVITGTIFQMKIRLKTTWQHPSPKHWHLLDYVIVRQKDRKDVLTTRAMRGAECWTDHLMVRSKLLISIQPCCPRTAPNKILNRTALNSPTTKDNL